MSFVDLITVISGLVSIAAAIATGIAALIDYLSKRGSNTQKMKNIMIVIFGSITAVSAIIALSIGFSRPTIAVNHVTGISFIPGHPAPTEQNFNTVVIVTPAPTPPTITKTLVENRTLTCINTCTSGLNVVLTSIVIDTTHHRMQWYFTITNNSTSACSYAYVSLYLEDQAGVMTNGGEPGTLTEEETPLNTGQTLQEYTTFVLVPQPGMQYTLHASPVCNGEDTDQLETFTF
jgi:hypothetical protein